MSSLPLSPNDPESVVRKLIFCEVLEIREDLWRILGMYLSGRVLAGHSQGSGVFWREARRKGKRRGREEERRGKKEESG